MIPVKPLSVKFNDEDERARVKALASLLGWTESQIVRDSVAYVIHLIHHPGSSPEPPLVTRSRLLLAHEAGIPLEKPPEKPIVRAKGSGRLSNPAA